MSEPEAKSRRFFSLTEGPKLRRAFSSLPEKLVSESLREPVETFSRNMERLSGVIFLVPALVAVGQGWEAKWRIACWEVLGQPWMTPAHAEMTDDVMNRFSALMNDPQRPGPVETDALLGMVDQVPLIQHGLEGMMSVLLTGSWAAFEALAADLWIAAVNHGPKRIVKRVFEFQKKQGGMKPGETKADGQDKSQEKMVLLSCLHDYEYDLRDKMGRLLYEQKKVEFQSLKSIRRAYEAIGGTAPAVFDQHGPHRDIWAHSAIRNCIAHKAGKIDRTFRTDAKGFDEFTALPRGSYLEITESLVVRMWNGTDGAAAALVAAVDAVLQEASPEAGSDDTSTDDADA